jgi:uncharacterized protein (TIGR02996 family)
MIEQQAFAASIAIAARTGDSLPRLVYADWQDENGMPIQADVLRRTATLAWPAPAVGPTVSQIVVAVRRLIESHPNISFQQSIRGPIAEVVTGVIGWDLGRGRIGLASATDTPLALARLISEAAAERDERVRQMSGSEYDSRTDERFQSALGELANLTAGA